MTTIDCQTCPVRGRMCGDCFVPVVARQWLSDPVPRATLATGPPPDPGDPGDVGLELDDAEWEAVDVFVRAGLVNTLDAARVTATRTRPARGRHVWSDVG